MTNITAQRQNNQPPAKPWFHRPVPLEKGSRIAVIGGGIAGLTAGLALQENGYHVTIFEHDHVPMNRASGNPAGILDPSLTSRESLEGQFYHTTMFRALDFYSSLGRQVFLSRGLLKFTDDSSDDNLYFPDPGTISPPKIRDILSQKLRIKNNVNITSFTHTQKWHLFEGDKPRATADAIVLCGGPLARGFSPTDHLPLEPVRGQITYLNAEKNDDLPRKTLCGKSYITPAFDMNGQMTIVTGASFSRNDTDMSLRGDDHRENLGNAEILWPGISKRDITGGRCAIRAYSPDHMPICGPIADQEQYQAAYKMLKHGPKHQNFIPAPYVPNLYAVTGLGARGFMSAPLLGDLMAALISGDALPVTQAVYESLHPARFLIRALKKGK
ncbi:MAG: FAD-dependent 5-carboxymethylaminomethyl-2-thiouridine(34) oxidoreductase MnmC [Emcibacter sp.]|nr:FAD-dependent 5-carboxymethylaminomethyl-2-thiouridine(34) oxidoreductase MnmC [Emcibacter sp.]